MLEMQMLKLNFEKNLKELGRLRKKLEMRIKVEGESLKMNLELQGLKKKGQKLKGESLKKKGKCF